MQGNLLRLTGGLLIWSLLCWSVALVHGDEPAELSEEVQGIWTRQLATPNGPVRIIKEHQGARTIVTAYDEQQNVIYAHESEFKVETTGRVRIFTFFNRRITAGPHAGATIRKPASFIYRIAGDQFIEVHGVLEGDDEAPNLILWKRVEDEVGKEN